MTKRPRATRNEFYCLPYLPHQPHQHHPNPAYELKTPKTPAVCGWPSVTQQCCQRKKCLQPRWCMWRKRLFFLQHYKLRSCRRNFARHWVVMCQDKIFTLPKWCQAGEHGGKTTSQFTAEPPKDGRTKGPEDQGTRGPKDQRTKGPKARGPRDQGTKGEDWRTRRFKDHKIWKWHKRAKGPKHWISTGNMNICFIPINIFYWSLKYLFSDASNIFFWIPCS